MNLSIFFSTLFYIGYIPVAPGTMGTLLAFLFCALLKPSFYLQVFLIPFIYVTGVGITGRAESIIGERDSPVIIIDEFMGYMVSVFMFDMTLKNLIVAFLLFRFFDILKPFPIRYVENKLKGGYGIMTDDLIAGIYANICLRLLFKIL